MIHLRGRVKFPTGGDEADASQPASRTGTIRCKSGADSIVWMGEDEGLPAFEKIAYSNVYLRMPFFSLKCEHLRVFSFCAPYGSLLLVRMDHEKERRTNDEKNEYSRACIDRSI
jgi:hypothetical protein